LFFGSCHEEAGVKAVRIHRYGGPEVMLYEEAPKPEPGPGELLVRVHASGVNPIDWKIREGHYKLVMRLRLPIVLGWDVSGVVEAVGAGVAGFRPGDEVFARPDIKRGGTYAEYVAIRASEAARKPKSIDHVHAAAVPLAGLTAWQGLFDKAGLREGQRVLVHAAAGGVGHFAVQLAKWKGAFVAGTASGRNEALVRSLGADQVVDYTRERFEDAVAPVDVVLDTLGGEVGRRSWKVLKRSGTLVSVLDVAAPLKGALRLKRGRFLLIKPSAAQLESIAGLIDAGKVKPLVENVFPLAEARRAQELSQSGRVRGKIVFKVT
jgi:NADPH:quinone reductase-like Zn-dependent oxidoreductase